MTAPESNAETTAETEAETTSQAETEGKETAEAVSGSYTIGIGQYAEHGSLDNCREGFIAGLAEEGFIEGENLTILEENAQADSGLAAQIVNNFAGQNADMICAIATPSAQSAFNAAMDRDIPVVNMTSRSSIRPSPIPSPQSLQTRTAVRSAR